MESAELLRLSPMTNTVPGGTGPAVQLQSIWPLGIGPSQDFALLRLDELALVDGLPFTEIRPSSSQHTIVSPATPMTRFTRCPPVG